MSGKTTTPDVVICNDPSAAALRVAAIIADAIRAKPGIVLGLATGGTPIGVYRELVRLHREAGLDFSSVTTFNLDEYVGLGPEHSQSYRQFMRDQLFDHVNVDMANTHVPNGLAADIATHAVEYESMISDAGGIDLQLLGIGRNGHIAFNEPGSAPDSRTRQVDLTDQTIQANSRFFDSIDQVPRHAITMGVGTILEAKRIVLMATGDGKASAIEQAIEGPLDPMNPASQLQRNSGVTFVLDNAAAKNLKA